MPNLLTLTQVAEHYGVTHLRIWRHVHKYHTLPATHIAGRLWMVDPRKLPAALPAVPRGRPPRRARTRKDTPK